MGLVHKHRRGARKHILGDEILTDDSDDNAGRSDVLLCAAVDNRVLGNVHRLTQEAGGYISDEILALGVRERLELRTVDGVVLADIHIVRIVVNRKIGAIRNVGKCLVFTGSNALGIAEFLSLLEGSLCPLAGHDVIRNLVLHQVHRDHCKLQMSTALQEQHLVVVRDVQKIPKILLCVLDDLVKYFGAMAHLHNGLTAPLVVEHLCCGFLQYFLRQYGRTCRKVIHSSHGFAPPKRIYRALSGPGFEAGYPREKKLSSSRAALKFILYPRAWEVNTGKPSAQKRMPPVGFSKVTGRRHSKLRN